MGSNVSNHINTYLSGPLIKFSDTPIGINIDFGVSDDIIHCLKFIPFDIFNQLCCVDYVMVDKLKKLKNV